MSTHGAGILSLLIAAEKSGKVNSDTDEPTAQSRGDNISSSVTAAPHRASSEGKNDNSSLCRGMDYYSPSYCDEFSNSNTQDSGNQCKRKPPLHFPRILPPKKRRLNDRVNNQTTSDSSTTTTVDTTLTDFSFDVLSTTNKKRLVNDDKLLPFPSGHGARTEHKISTKSSVYYSRAAKAALAQNFHREQRALALSTLKESSQAAMKEAGLINTVSCVYNSSRSVIAAPSNIRQLKEIKTPQSVSLMEQDGLNIMQQVGPGKVTYDSNPTVFPYQLPPSFGGPSPTPSVVAASDLAKHSLYQAYLKALQNSTHL